jgi:DNA-binding response OmpR family regulator
MVSILLIGHNRVRAEVVNLSIISIKRPKSPIGDSNLAMALKGKEVLIIDDQSDIRLLSRKILENQSLTVSEASSVDEAIELAIKKPPHLIIVDLHMPKRNGFDFLEQRLKTPSLASVPVIVISGLQDQKSVYKAIQLGAKDYIVKPFAATILIQKVRKNLRDQDFIGHTFSDKTSPSLTVTVNADISKVTETGFLLESPMKLSEKAKIKLICEAFEKQGLTQDQFLTSEKSGVRAISGNYVSSVNVVGLKKSLSRNLKREK